MLEENLQCSLEVSVHRRLGVESKKRIICKPDMQKALKHIKIPTV
jgi:hypothetical protein